MWHIGKHDLHDRPNGQDAPFRSPSRQDDVRFLFVSYLQVDGGFDFGIGDGAFADDGPLVAIDADDSGSEGAVGVAGIKNQRETIAQLLGEIDRVAARGMTGKIGASAGDRAACGSDQRSDHMRIRPAESDAAAIAGDLQRQAVRSLDD